ncbi:MAG: hypothetical protein HY062_04555 [Bacteroidetes bacterium]|nr:hypothetical protein [Bacteroidota bacterium]
MTFKAHIHLVVIAFCLMFKVAYTQDSLKYKPSFRVYPSLHTMYGIGFYSINTGNYKQPNQSYVNTNFNLGLQCNASLKFKNNLHVELYIGYSRWNYANLFPVGLAIKPKLNKKKNGFYLKFAGGHTFGKRFYDPDNKWPEYSTKKEPKDNGAGKFHLKAGLEKNWYINEKQSISFGFELLIQTINAYYFDAGGPGSQVSVLTKTTTDYKFAGLMIAYHFY